MQRLSIAAFLLTTFVLTPSFAEERSIKDLGGAYSWGMSADDVLRQLDEQARTKYGALIAHEPDVYKQDQLRQTERDLEQQLRDSLVKFDGVSPSSASWNTSLVQHEFAQRNDESMLFVAEPKLRRFLFFWHDKLYKQVIAFNAEHAAEQGHTFEDFTRVLQERYGTAEMRFSPLRTQADEMKLDHLEWPASGDYQLFAYDQTDDYDNYCLVLTNPSVASQVESHRKATASATRTGSALIDAVTAPASASTAATDRNEDIVDRILKRK